MGVRVRRDQVEREKKCNLKKTEGKLEDGVKSNRGSYFAIA